MKKVLLFEDVYGLYGGIERVINNIIANSDSSLFTFSLCINHMASFEYMPFLEEHHVKIYELQKYWEKNPIKRHHRGFKAFKKFVYENKFDIIHFNISNAIDLKYIAIAKNAGAKNLIAHCHNDETTSAFKRVIHYCVKPFYVDKANYYIACSDKAGKWLYTSKIMKSSKYKTIENGIDTQSFAFSIESRINLRKEFNANSKTRLIMHVGRFNKQKNQAKVLAVFKAFHSINPDSMLVFFGAGDSSSIKKSISNLSLSNSVIIHSPTTNINKYYSAFDCFVFPSLYEGFGLALLEAETNGLPCVISDTIPNSVIFTKNVVALSIDENDIAWAKAIDEFSFIPRKDNVNLAKEKGFDQKRQAEKIYSIYNEFA